MYVEQVSLTNCMYMLLIDCPNQYAQLTSYVCTYTII